MASYIKLKNPPIKEIIFTISFKENIEPEKLEKFKASSKIAENFPVVNKSFNTHVQAIQNQTPTTRVLSDGFIFGSKEPHTYLIQARRGSFSFHKINGYVSFEDMVKELKIYWDELIACCGTLTIVNLSVRYLNFIEKNKEEKINDLITINTTHPFGDNNETHFTQHRFNYENEPEITVNVVTARAKDKDKDGILIDVILNKKVQLANGQGFDFASFNDMRTAKNDIFFKSITEETIKKYNI